MRYIINVMATVGGLEVPEELFKLFMQLVRVADDKRYGAVAQNGHLLSREQKIKIKTRSLLPQIRDYWIALSEPERDAWVNAASYSKYTGWNLFVQDTAYRIKYGLVGLATPNIHHQYKVGKIEINAPASGAVIVQYHPNTYWKRKKIRGTKALYEDVKITEKLILPLTIGLDYAADLTPVSPVAFAKFKAVIYSSYQGITLAHEISVPLNFEQTWVRADVTSSGIIGAVRDYNLYIELNDLRGSLYFDNIRAEHTNTNFARDFRCNDVNNSLSTVNYQIEKSWEEEYLPTGAAYDSIYPE